MSNNMSILHNNTNQVNDSIVSINKDEPSIIEEDLSQTKKSTEVEHQVTDTVNEVPEYNEVMQLIGQVNVDDEIENMLDAFYVNDEPELKFFSEFRVPKKGNIVAIDQNLSGQATVEDNVETGTGATEVGTYDFQRSQEGMYTSLGMKRLGRNENDY